MTTSKTTTETPTTPTTPTTTRRAQLDARRAQLESDLAQLHLDEIGASLAGDFTKEAEIGELAHTVQLELGEVVRALAQQVEEETPEETPEEERPRELDRAAFAAWLAAKEDDAIVGRGSSRSQCPLATWLTETERPAEGAWVEVDYLTWDVISGRTLEPHDLPAWAVKFAEAIDTVHPASPTSAVSARAILESTHSK